ncbi:MAG: DUF1566 domain-containing protein [Ottowia sp.]|uniref:Lcl C-terminal domain-containing protein n=1 Tax=Ottowia sp. TaxID=1898956 RepID=UPI0039E5933F
MTAATFLRAAALALLAPAAWAAPFTPHADGTVTDAATGLVWDDCYLGQGVSDLRCPATTSTAQLTWPEALTAAQTMNALAYKGHADWRVPNIKELLSLRDLGRTLSPSIDPAAFPDTLPGQYWTSTTLASFPSAAWTVHFSFGDSVFAPKTDPLYVRLVRGGPSPNAFDALDTTPPVTTAGPTVTPGTGGANASVSVTVNEDATGYWLVLPAGQPAPTPAVLAGGGPIGTAGAPIVLGAGAPASFSVSGLTAGAVYVLYFVARDGSGNLQANVTATVFTAAAAAAPTAVPATSAWGLALLAALLAGLGWRRWLRV